MSDVKFFWRMSKIRVNAAECLHESKIIVKSVDCEI